MARKDAEKPMLPAASVPAGHVQCAADAECRKPGRMFIEGLLAKERVCIVHFYEAIDRGVREIEPPRPPRPAFR